MRAFVTGTLTPTGLFIIRHLARLGYEVTAAGHQRLDFCLYSNALSRKLYFPSVWYDPVGFARAVINELRTGNYDIYVPVFEEGYVMSVFREELARYTRCQFMPFDAIMQVHDKTRSTALAQELGIPVPESTMMPESWDEVERLARQVEYPVIMKLRKSCSGSGQRIAENPDQLLKAYRTIVKQFSIPESELPLMQRFVKGSLLSSVTLAKDGEILGRVVFRGLHVYPIIGGTSCLKEVIDRPDIDEYDALLIKKLNWTGFMSFDYIEDSRTGKAYFIDANPRLAPGAITAYIGGVDYLRTYIDMLYDRPVSTLPRPPVGLRTRWQLTDVAALLTSVGCPGFDFRGKLRYWRDWFRRGKCYDEVNSLRDPLPGLMAWVYSILKLPLMMSKDGSEVFLQSQMFNRETFNLDEFEKEVAAAGGM